MQSICGIPGVSASGIKEGKYGLTLIRAHGSVAGVFTRNLMKAPCIRLMEERVRRGTLDAVIANSGCANAYTGERGYRDAEEMGVIAAGALGVEPTGVGVASTGVIGRYLDLPLIQRQCAEVAPRLSHNEEAERLAARGIMTTDTFEKHALVRRDGFSVGGIAKGSGMIAPNMGTMLAFLYTDAELEPAVLTDCFRVATGRTFNRIVVDGDTSTNDIALCTATGEAGLVDEREFRSALEACCRSLAIQIAKDGEGATRLIEVTVSGACTEEDAAAIAHTIVESPLVKTAVYGQDPNWGRIIAAAGRAGVEFDPDRVSLSIASPGAVVELVREGRIVVDLARAKEAMGGRQVIFLLRIGDEKGAATAWGCDLTERYVEINGRYTT
jgi:glutamate N-acetyltransferase/amino-acid N-acetyltransferase